MLHVVLHVVLHVQRHILARHLHFMQAKGSIQAEPALRPNATTTSGRHPQVHEWCHHTSYQAIRALSRAVARSLFISFFKSCTFSAAAGKRTLRNVHSELHEYTLSPVAQTGCGATGWGWVGWGGVVCAGVGPGCVWCGRAWVGSFLSFVAGRVLLRLPLACLLLL